MFKTPKIIKKLTNIIAEKDLEIRLNKLNPYMKYKIFVSYKDGYKFFTVNYYVRASTYSISGSIEDIKEIEAKIKNHLYELGYPIYM